MNNSISNTNKEQMGTFKTMPARGKAPVPLSILDWATTGKGYSVKEGIQQEY